MTYAPGVSGTAGHSTSLRRRGSERRSLAFAIQQSGIVVSCLTKCESAAGHHANAHKNQRFHCLASRSSAPARSFGQPGLSDLALKSGHLKQSQYVDSRRCQMAKKPSRIRRTFTPQFKKDAVAL